MTVVPSVDVVVLTWNDGKEAEQAVGSALASQGVDPIVWVVDNGSDPPYRPSSSEVRLHRSDVNLGVSRGRRLGTSFGNAPYVCFLDSDALLGEHALERLIQVLDVDDTLSCVGPVFDGIDLRQTGGCHPSLARKAARAAGITRRYASRGPSDASITRVDFVIGACTLFRRAAYNDAGGLSDEGLFGPEDVELCRRFRASGGGVAQVRGAGVFHDPRRAWRNPISRRGLAHLSAVIRYYWRTGRG